MFPTYHNHHRMMAPTVAPLRPVACHLEFRQQPREALVTTEGKEKSRKPVDPPPILEMTVSNQEDPQQQFLQSPYLFVSTSLFKADQDEPWEGSGDKTLAGTLVSSLHRLKDVSNKDGGFFVFGDISIKVQGTFRLHFSLYNFLPETSEVQCLAATTSDKFKVLLPKDFKGMEESTYLSRAFSDQGVRLRLRKEPRGVIGNKRAYPYNSETNSNPPLRPNNSNEYSSYDETSSPNKRYKAEPEDRKDSYSDLPGLSASTYPTAYQTTHNYAISPFGQNRAPAMPSSFGTNEFIGQLPWTSGATSSDQTKHASLTHTSWTTGITTPEPNKDANLGQAPWTSLVSSPGVTMTASRSSYPDRPGVMSTGSNPYSNPSFQSSSIGLTNPTQHHMGFSNMYPSYSQRANNSSGVDSMPNLSLEFGNHAPYPS